MKIAVISITRAGNSIFEKLKAHFNVELYSKDTIDNFNLQSISKTAVENYRAVIFISSTGIAVRAICKYIKSKVEDPAVVVIDSCGKFVISLLSGHLGGANALTENIASVLGAVPVITTATDNMGLSAPDSIAVHNDLVIDNLETAKYISALLVEGKKVAFIDQKNIIKCPEGYVESMNGSCGAVVVTDNLKLDFDAEGNFKLLKLIRKDIVLGIGCRKNFTSGLMQNTVLEILESRNIDIRAVAAVATVDLKAKEKAILDLKDFLGCGLDIFSREEIRQVQCKFEGSDFVEKTIGVRGVCQPCAWLSGAVSLTGKIKCGGMTLCIGRRA
ncbi:MAG: cobalt-precorrin 5A hydrolase [Clostridium sp.]|jgi:cobalt-precorrin 5A hydrolase|uniref:cobalt-precorrin 5A hydrolase n=1 Tax=Clostridium sp. TaxID=1506 RepID=UPI0025C7204A|nr:cobalt-precorrin 5A hydrolase [Clostridium sp.]MCH3962929.1 cobalt-precorrin 5A hydrolase [Clostridium sp.]MCI1715656.1 cobalt-precorrin 5A hydrolase [Clostridium sp.]MCI1800140.1 cobalt-precorrin 5A hydrolase [Clostridium sp.]MCI1814053.1 cobalt-precorrin 5A hydrolase [Clostridium sp.]MCI1870951.1 cobalt-precorrin 5A hydrolase [Clostridium sp.]